MINPDKFGRKGANLGDNRFDHINRFFTALREIAPERGRDNGSGVLNVNYNVGRSAGGAFTKVNDFFDSQKGEGEKEE